MLPLLLPVLLPQYQLELLLLLLCCWLLALPCLQPAAIAHTVQEHVL